MTQSFNRRTFLKGVGAVGLLAALSGCTRSATPVINGLPAQTVWATYPTGTGTYNDVATIANMVTTESGMRVRLMTGDTGIARIGPLISGTAQYSRAGDEYFYAFEGNDEYASEAWGPSPSARSGHRPETTGFSSAATPASRASRICAVSATRASSPPPP